MTADISKFPVRVVEKIIFRTFRKNFFEIVVQNFAKFYIHLERARPVNFLFENVCFSKNISNFELNISNFQLNISNFQL